MPAATREALASAAITIFMWTSLKRPRVTMADGRLAAGIFLDGE
jgi:hypothetical protein